MYSGDYIAIKIKCLNNFCQYILDKFRNTMLLNRNEDENIFEVNVFEGGFIKWLMSQSVDNVIVIFLISTINKIKEEVKKIMLKYGGMD